MKTPPVQSATVALVTVGDELLCGHTVDTLTAAVGRRLQGIGWSLRSSQAVADDEDAIVAALVEARRRAGVVIVTGGLGPTDDDVTRQALATYLGRPLVEQPALLEQIESFFRRRRRDMPPRNRRQALIPEGATAIANPVGTAPGIEVTDDRDGRFFVLPGVPHEAEVLLDRVVLPRLRATGQARPCVVRRLHCTGLGESELAERLGSLMQRGRNPQVNTTVQAGVITLHVTGRGSDHGTVGSRVEEVVQTIRDQLGAAVFGVDDESLSQVVGRDLRRRGWTLAVAESCTGGWLAKSLTDPPGASAFFTGGWVTYSNRAKIDALGVSPEILDRHGAVSEPVARAMAEGAQQRAGTHLAVATTGIAGPTGATARKPVGLVFVAIAGQGPTEVREYRFHGTRAMVRERSVVAGLNLIRLRLCF